MIKTISGITTANVIPAPSREKKIAINTGVNICIRLWKPPSAPTTVAIRLLEAAPPATAKPVAAAKEAQAALISLFPSVLTDKSKFLEAIEPSSLPIPKLLSCVNQAISVHATVELAFASPIF